MSASVGLRHRGKQSSQHGTDQSISDSSIHDRRGSSKERRRRLNVNNKSGRNGSWVWVGCFGALVVALIQGGVWYEVSRTVGGAYMDEIFHGPQTQAYCDGRWNEWDGAITTLPGLYVTAVAAVKVLGLNCHSIVVLRAINALGITVGIYFVALGLISGRSTQRAPWVRDRAPGWVWGLSTVARSMLMLLIPPLWFSSQLYYTDGVALLAILVTHYLGTVKRWHWVAALAGGAAVFARQTSIVWAGYTAAVALLDVLDGDLWKVKERFWQVFKVALPYVILAGCFGAFVVVNEGIVVGDRDNHAVALHLVQPAYFAAFAGAVLLPWTVSWSNIRRAVLNFGFTPLPWAAAAVALTAAVHWGTIAHRFILSDNRHYTFYIWARWFGAFREARFVLIPGYLYAGWVIGWIVKDRGMLWRLVFWGCVAAALIPSPLIEPRYFIAPLALLMVELPTFVEDEVLAVGIVRELFGLGVLVAVNALTMIVFLYFPFERYDSEMSYDSRFMW